MTPREFGNLVGRAGRPGVATEGVSLVLMPSPALARDGRERWRIGLTTQEYFALTNSILRGAQRIAQPTVSALAELLRHIREIWDGFARGDSADFLAWLEQCAPLVDRTGAGEAVSRAIDAVDSLDAILLSIVVELEQLRTRVETLSAIELEDRLKAIWRHTFAAQVATTEPSLEQMFVQRGGALANRIYTDSLVRRRLYRTSLPPTSGQALLRVYPEIREHWATGGDYATWDTPRKLAFLETTARLISTVKAFELRPGVTSRDPWPALFRWWLDPDSAPRLPQPQQVSAWHDFVNREFTYKLNWGIGSCIALAVEDSHGSETRATSLEEWPATGMPWIVLWLKELIVWGTLEPVAALLLSRRLVFSRHAARTMAGTYYQSRMQVADTSDPLDARSIRRWAATLAPRRLDQATADSGDVQVVLLRDFGRSARRTFRVIPIANSESILWADVSGHVLAQSPRLPDSDLNSDLDFLLHPDRSVVQRSPYVESISSSEP